MGNKINGLLRFVGIFAIGFFASMLYKKITTDQNDSIKVNQKYIKCYGNDENPFEEIKCDTVLILDVKDGYVKYQKVKGNYPFSTTCRVFLMTAKLIK